MKTAKKALTTALSAAAILIVAGCSALPWAGPARVDFAKGLTTLEIDVQMPDGDSWSHTLICGPDGKDPSGECGQIAEFGYEGFTKEHNNCKEQEGDGWSATISGVLAGQPVNKSFDKTTDCGEKDWNALSRLFDPDNEWSDDPADYNWEQNPDEEFDSELENPDSTEGFEYDENGLPILED